MEVLALLAVGAMNIACFVIGAKVGQKVSKGEEIKLPAANPMEAYKVHKAKQEAQREQERYDTIVQNIEVYDGSPQGQKDVPRG